MAEKRKNLSERLLRRRSTDAVTFGDFIYDPGGTFGPRTQADFQLVFLFSGSMEVRVNEMNVVLGHGKMCLLRPGQQEYFTFAARNPTHHGWCSARPGALAALPEARLTVAAEEGVISTISERTGRLLEVAFSLPEGASAGLLESLACAVFEEFLLTAGNEKAFPLKTPMPEAVRRAWEFMEAHYPEPLTLARLGRAAGVAPKHLGRLFRLHAGVTPIRQLWRVRTEKGAQMLTETGLSVGEIAERVGIRNPFHFSRLIRQTFGVSPRKLRAERWNAGADGAPLDGE